MPSSLSHLKPPLFLRIQTTSNRNLYLPFNFTTSLNSGNTYVTNGSVK